MSIHNIIPNLYVGDIRAAVSYGVLKKNGIRAIVNATTMVPNFYPRDFIYMRVPVNDNGKPLELYLMYEYLTLSVLFIRMMLFLGYPVLVHCWAGSQRSAIIVAAVLCSFGSSPCDAIVYVRRKRPWAFGGHSHKDIRPNFLLSLCRWCCERYKMR